MAVIGFVFAGTALGYAGLIWLSLRGWRGRPEGGLLLAAALATVLWAVLGGLAATGGWVAPAVVEVANLLRLGLWLWLCYALWSLVAHGRARWWAPDDRVFAAGAGVVGGGLGWFALQPAIGGNAAVGAVDVLAVLAVAIFALALVESTLAAADGGSRWALKHLLIGLAGLFAFDIFKISEAFLLGDFTAATRLAQPLVAASVLPFVVTGARRVRTFSVDIHVDRQVVLRTTALLAAGIYLLAVAFAGLLFQELDVAWGTALQLTFVLTALLVLATALMSGAVRSHVRRFLERGFFDFTYDYRHEWQRFVATMGDTATSARPLHERAIQALADPLECTGGVLFLRDRSGGLKAVGAWNWAAAAALEPPPAAVLDATGPELAAVDLDAGEPSAEVAAWRRTLSPLAFVIALHHGDRLLGAVAVGKPRVRRRLSWEEHELLQLFAAQIANSLREEQNARILAETRRFEAVSRRFSFVAHDLKNIVSQLAPLVRLAHRHGDNPEFLRDVLTTVEGSVEKMNSVLLRLRTEGEDRTIFDVEAVIADLARRRSLAGERVDTRLGDAAAVQADRSAFTTVVENLVDNAFQAGAGRVELAVDADAEISGRVRLTVTDDGPGMSAAFVRERLFEPFVSSKPDGFGIGMYQCRAWVESWDGELTVASTPGGGTTVAIRLPRADADAFEVAAQ
jgi:putative PEP-CTERM system histidine kinase